MNRYVRQLIGGSAAFAALALGTGCSSTDPNQFEGHYYGVGVDEAAYYAIEADVDASGAVTGTLTYYDGTTSVPATVDIPDDTYGLQFDLAGQVDGMTVTVTSVKVDDTDPQATFTGTFTAAGVVTGTVTNDDSGRDGTFTARPVAAADDIAVFCGSYDLLEVPPAGASAKGAYDDGGDTIFFSVNGDDAYGVFDTYTKGALFTGLVGTYEGQLNLGDAPCSTGCGSVDGTVTGTYDGSDDSLDISASASATEDVGTVGHQYQYIGIEGGADSANLNVGFFANTNYCYSWDVAP